jgi:1,3-beta-glucan synthase
MEPRIFATEEDGDARTMALPEHGEARRRIQFLLQSMSTSMPHSMSLATMPSFTVLSPHYSEKIILSLRELIYEGQRGSSLLDYLKSLYPSDWLNFVNDSKSFCGSQSINCNQDDLSVRAIGFQSSDPSNVLRTRIWASLRSQTLYVSHIWL